jgi:hypothetical protein
MKLVSAFSFASVLALALVVIASAIPVSESTLSLDTANALSTERSVIIPDPASALIPREDRKKADVLESDPLTYILPFHLRIFETCVLGSAIALVTYSNGNIVVKDLPLNHNQVVAIEHLAPTFSNPLQLGPYDYTKHRVPFSYKSCKWNDDEWWKECGECRPGAWTAGPIDCKDPNNKVSSRTKDMDCSFLLAKRVSAGCWLTLRYFSNWQQPTVQSW